MIINYKTLIVAALAIGSIFFCKHFDLHAEFPLTLVGIAIVFPVVFSIDSAYKRRERALASIADMKGHIVAIYLACRDWEGATEDFFTGVKPMLVDVYTAVGEYLTSGDPEDVNLEKKISQKVSELSRKVQGFRELGLQAGEISRVNQYISKILIDIENIKMILKYRTPVTLRAYSKIFIYSFPLIYGPYFVAASENYTSVLVYVMPLLFSFILVSLDNIQMHLENPFDQVGEDDISFDEKELLVAMHSEED
jgi:hypothetical protein